MWKSEGSDRHVRFKTLTQITVYFSLIVATTNACFALGGCGFGGCIPYCYLRYCAHARDTKTFTLDNSILQEHRQSPDREHFLAEHLRPIGEVSQNSLTATSPTRRSMMDERFIDCCQRKHLPEACLQNCNYATYSAESLHAMFFRTNACPIEFASEIHFCASGGFDHRACCEKNGVGSTFAGPKCFVFCAEEPKNATQLDFSYVPCLAKLEEMKQCFRVSNETSHKVSSTPGIEVIRSENVVL